MDYYFAATDAAEALGARELARGPAEGFDAIEAKDIIPCPHLEQLIRAATGAAVPSFVRELRTVWPPAGTPPPMDENSPFLTGPTISELPDALRDGLADVSMSEGVAEAWAGELWSYGATDALRVGGQVAALAARARSQGRRLYWWSEL